MEMILWYWGDPTRVIFARSASKPIQAIPVVESGAAEAFGIADDELAVICASHNGEPVHIQTVARILGKAGLTADFLRCGAEYPMYIPAEDALKKAGEPRRAIYCDCSGKHAGMLLTARTWASPWTAMTSRSTLYKSALPPRFWICVEPARRS